MLGIICGHIHNYFTEPNAIRSGEWTIQGGAINLSEILIENQYFRIVGSALNDGVYQYPAEGLSDETFDGEIWPMRVPRDFLSLCGEIEAWQAKYGVQAASPFSSENVIGVYSYSKASGDGGGSSANPTWESAFKSRLNQWRKIR